jgi:hypothetical protein
VGKLSALTVGASNAAKTATPLKRKGVKTTNLGKVGWWISEDSVDELLLHAAWDEIVVLHCLNSSCFCTGQDGLYQALGNVVVAKGLQLDNLLETLEQILKGSMDKLTFLVCPCLGTWSHVAMHMTPSVRMRGEWRVTDN